MTVPLPDLEPAALEAAIATHDRILALPATPDDQRLIAEIIRAYLAARSIPEAGKAVHEIGPLTLAAHRTRAEEALCALEWALEALRHAEPISKQYPEPRERHKKALKMADETISRLRSSSLAYVPAPSGANPVGIAGTMPGTDGFTMACFKASDVPVGTKLYVYADEERHDE